MIQLTYDRENSGRLPPLDDVVLHYARMVLDSVGGNKTQAAKKLGIDRRSLYRLLAKMKSREKEAMAMYAPYEAATQDVPLSVQEPDKGSTGGADSGVGIDRDGEYMTDGVKW